MLLIYCPGSSSRCDYVFDWILKQQLAIAYRITSDQQEFRDYPNEKLNYSSTRMSGGFFVRSAPLLSLDGITKIPVEVTEKKGVKILFPNSDCDLGFDIFSAVFYMISRYEEYLPFTPDSYGRFKDSDSLASQHHFLQVPVVDIWIQIFKESLQEIFPSLTTGSGEFNAILTYDIDVAYKYRGRSVPRVIGASLRDLAGFKLKEILNRKAVLLKIQKDPWDVYGPLRETLSKNRLSSIFFFLLADKTRHDRNLKYSHPLTGHLIREVQSFSDLGIHPSFYSSIFPEKIAIEKERLERLAGKKIFKSRQHFLKFNLPGTYRSLIAAGIKEDYSMGFPGAPGFRAGTCKPFNFYDLKNEKNTPLTLFPVTFMEGSFLNSHTGPEESISQILRLIKLVRDVQGTFVSIWHNHTLSGKGEYSDWEKVHDRMVAELCQPV